MKRLKKIILILVLLPLALMTGCAGGRIADGSASEHVPAGAETSMATGMGRAAETLPEEPSGTETASTAEAVMYRDGTYKAQTQPDYEGYFTKAEVTVKDGKIVSVDWSIYDANRNDKPFDEKYEEVFAGNDYYTEQSRSDWKGSRTYGPKLIETQDPDGVDAVSGATWTNKKFREIVKVALEEAEK
jgi:major membrane immunogen (membrane-anchored lipoprotein)